MVGYNPVGGAAVPGTPAYYSHPADDGSYLYAADMLAMSNEAIFIGATAYRPLAAGLANYYIVPHYFSPGSPPGWHEQFPWEWDSGNGNDVLRFIKRGNALGDLDPPIPPEAYLYATGTSPNPATGFVGAKTHQIPLDGPAGWESVLLASSHGDAEPMGMSTEEGSGVVAPAPLTSGRVDVCVTVRQRNQAGTWDWDTAKYHSARETQPPEPQPARWRTSDVLAPISGATDSPMQIIAWRRYDPNAAPFFFFQNAFVAGRHTNAGTGEDFLSVRYEEVWQP